MPTINHNIAGRVTYGVGSGGKLILQSGWEASHIATVHIPQLKGVQTYGGKFSGNVRFFKPAIPQMAAAFAEVERLGLANKILHWDGSFVPRLMRGSSSSPSNHSWGTAFDINAQWNGFKQKPAAAGAKGDLHAVAQVFKKFGFTWGGDWKNSPDGMHFEVNRILSPAEIESLTREQSVYGKPAKQEPSLVLVTKGKGKELVYSRVKSAKLESGTFTADKSEVLAIIAGGDARVPVADYLSKTNTPEFAPRGNHLDDPERPVMYLFVDTK